jgi:hypothetical protein
VVGTRWPWQDLVDGHGFPARYASVRRFVVALRGRTPVPEQPGQRQTERSRSREGYSALSAAPSMPGGRHAVGAEATSIDGDEHSATMKRVMAW